MKSTLSFLLALILLLSLATGIKPSASAEETEYPEVFASGAYEYEIQDDGTAIIVKYTGSAYTLTIPEELDDYLVTAIGGYAFYEVRDMFCVELPNGILAMPTPNPPPNVSSITLPNSVTTIHARAFDMCYYLKSIIIPDSVTSIGEDAFSKCPNLTATVGRDSYARQYCIDNDIPYTYPDANDWLND